MQDAFELIVEDRFVLTVGLVVVGPANGTCTVGDELELVDGATVHSVRCTGIAIPRITDLDALERNRARHVMDIRIEGVGAQDVRPGQRLRKPAEVWPS